MGNFETSYPVQGSAALKPSSTEQYQAGTIIEFPAIAQNEFGSAPFEQNSAMSQPSDYSQLTALFTTPFENRTIVRSLKEGSLRGVSKRKVEAPQAIACGLVMTIASFLLFFL